MDIYQKKKNGRGFTLIELIIAIAILVILTGILAPQFLKYIERSRRAVCLSDMDALIREYQVEEIENPPSEAGEAQRLFADVVTAKGGKADNLADSFYTAGIFTGICKSGGTYSCMFSEDFAYLSIDCSKHGENILDIKTLKERMDKLDLSDLGGTFTTLSDYLATHPIVNSEATGTGEFGGYGSLAKAISAKLEKQGIITSGRSWRIYRTGNVYNMFLTERKITEEDIINGTTVICTKYDIANDKVVRGTVEVNRDPGGYPVIKGDSFTEIPS